MPDETISVAIVGGCRRIDDPPPHISLVCCPSSRYAGAARFRSALEAIRNRAVAIVIVLVRWLGHSEFHALTRACRAASVQLVIVPGGVSSARRALIELVGQCGGR
jgi:hypothetical protein